MQAEVHSLNKRFANTKWEKYDSTEIGINKAFDIINNPKTGELYFCSNNGLTIYKDGKWTTLGKSRYKDLPSNRVYWCFQIAYSSDCCLVKDS